MNNSPFLVSILLNGEYYVQILINIDCLSYGIIDIRFAEKHNFERFKIRFREIIKYNERKEKKIDEIIVVRINIDEH
jgi:hypothetical protein